MITIFKSKKDIPQSMEYIELNDLFFNQNTAILMLVLCQREGFSASSSIIRYPIPNSFWIYGLSPGVLPNFLRIFAIFTCSFFVLL